MNAEALPTTESDQDQAAVIKVFGVGGGGCNALQQIISADIPGVTFKCINTDTQALARFPSESILKLGANLTRGLGAGADPAIGKQAAEESREEIAAAIGNADMLFITSGMGGGTGTGAAPTIAKIARELGVLTVAVVTEPFSFEGDKRIRMAETGLLELRDNADSMIVVPNENLLTFLGPDVTLLDAFAAANDVVTNAVQSIAELITTSGLINVDFADVKSVMTEMGHAIMSTGTGSGENRARDAAVAAIESPLLNNINLKEARGILANITANKDLSMGEFQIVGDIIRKIAAENANVVIGTVLNEDTDHEIQVTVVATGLNPPDSKSNKPNHTFKSPTPVKPVEKNLSVAANTVKASAPKTATTPKPAPKPAPKPTSAPENQNKVFVTEAPKAPSTYTKPVMVNRCYVCGNPEDDHREKCPLNNSDSTLVKKTDKADKNSSSTSEAAIEIEEVTEETPVEIQKGLNGTQKKSLAGAAAGILALGAIFYVATKQNAPEELEIETKIGAAHEDKANEAAKEFVKRYIGPVPFPAPQSLAETDDNVDATSKEEITNAIDATINKTSEEINDDEE